MDDVSVPEMRMTLDLKMGIGNLTDVFILIVISFG
jgi:hypothetical protein